MIVSVPLRGQFFRSMNSLGFIGKQVRLSSAKAPSMVAPVRLTEEPSKRAFASLQSPSSELSAFNDAENERREKMSTSLARRFNIMTEITVSKIFPAGFGWQSASIAASELGCASDTLSFACFTGAGDGIGVLGGHMAYFGIKKAIVDSSIDMTKQLHTGILLGSAAFCSGTAWQPVVNILQGMNLPFSGVFAGTWLACGTAFYVGLRVGRTILSGVLEHVHEPTYENSTRDAGLSLAIGGATGFFVGTDAVYLPDQNFLIDIVGIKEGTSALASCAIAGSSTSLGFASSQTVFNLVYPPRKSWID
jgi:hypothetical protein